MKKISKDGKFKKHRRERLHSFSVVSDKKKLGQNAYLRAWLEFCTGQVGNARNFEK